MSQGKPDCLYEDNEFETCGMWFRPRTLEKVGDKIDGHAHHFDHATIVIDGAAHVIGKYPDGKIAFEDDIKSGDVLPIQKNITHEFTATEAPYKHFCAYPSRIANGKIAGENTGWIQAAN